MKTTAELHAMLNADRTAYFAECKSLRAAKAELETIYRESIEGKPSETVKRFVEAVGYDKAVAVVASMVNVKAWDGRISKRVKDWAKGLETSWDEEAARELWLHGDEIHPAHLNQIGAAMMNFAPEKPKNSKDNEPATKEEKPLKNTFAFTPTTITTNGKTFPARYELQDEADKKRDQAYPTVYIYATVDEKSVKIAVPADDSNYSAALTACKAAQEETPTQPEEAPEAPQPQEEAPTQPEETPAPDSKKPHGPIPEKTFVGTSITGARYKIIFDAEAQRTRVIIPNEYKEQARAAVENAGFYYSRALDSWNKKLTFRAYRAAQALAVELDKILAA